MRAIRIVVMAGAMCAAVVGAQAQETLPFHQGQWGVEADVAGGGGGLVRFVTPKTALVLNVGGSRYTFHDESGSTFPADRRFTTVNLSIGMRRHRSVAPRVVGTFGVALGGNWTRQHYEYGGLTPSTETERGMALGPMLSLGGQYLLTDHLSAGVGYNTSFFWGSQKRTGSGSSVKTTNSGFASGFAPLYVTLYF